jgi:heme/copper-type cytochrome/quinol oxidase subunit 2
MKTWKILGYLGLIPFAVFFYYGSEQSLFVINSKFSFIGYSAIILSFIAGSLWRESSIYRNSQTQIISNLVSLIAFVCLLVNISTSLIVLPITYSFIFVYQLKLYNQSTEKEFSSEYMTMRFWLTLVVIIFHLLAFNLWLV